ncbi:hypothetical protein WOLCODRAFT_88910 [Wolfiporia cocos MD-104 SS10]|uniref:Uncharacterized protein n=1 Tax=Wolfiporia cocos (strain MD-104) TaxID=742152 RepID=A0A2H3JG88_WOLCO|nr:hypothetical protein WOLCODRAFT_88910 [Wolfiporia cocos MD-104 SS10]
MVFSLFSAPFIRKQAPPPSEPVTQPTSPPQPEPSTSSSVQESSTIAQTQLRTPSPSIESVSNPRDSKAKPISAVKEVSLAIEERVRRISISPSRAPAAVPAAQVAASTPIEPTVDSLTTHIRSIPPKTLHAYVLAQLPKAPEPVLSALATFCAELTPPPRLHCVRCHKDYVEIENDDRSCLVAHDDESAVVERVGRAAQRGGRPAGEPGSIYETTWGCCGKITEGDGDQGPPDGWCYEGKHTTDIKRARFRADSTPQDDKLTSCLRFNCHGIRDQLPRASTRKRRRSTMVKEPDSDEDASEGESDSGVDEIAGRPKAAAKGKGKGKGKAKAAGDEAMDVDAADPEVVSQSGSVRSSAKLPTTTPKRRGRPSKLKPLPDATPGESPADTKPFGGEPTAATSTAKRRGRKPKSKALVSDSDDSAKVREQSTARTTAGREKPVNTEGSTATVKSKMRGRKPKLADENSTKKDDAEEEGPRKRRKISA